MLMLKLSIAEKRPQLYEELVEKGGLYKVLYDTQFAKQKDSSAVSAANNNESGLK